MSGRGMDEIFSLLDLCIEQFNTEEIAVVVEGYLHNIEVENCVLCGDYLNADGDCVDKLCNGPKSITRAELVDHAKHAMFDNMNDAGFDPTSTGPLVTALELLEYAQYSPEGEDSVKAYRQAQQQPHHLRQMVGKLNEENEALKACLTEIVDRAGLSVCEKHWCEYPCSGCEAEDALKEKTN